MLIRSLLAASLSFAMAFQPALAAKFMVGQLIAKGQVKINGIASASGATLFFDDRVVTEESSIAEMIFNGGHQVMLAASSAAALDRDSNQIVVKLERGALAVLGNSGQPAIIAANGILVKPAAGRPVVIEIAIHGNSLKVLSRRGAALVVSADKTLEVTEGKELDATVGNSSPQGPVGRRSGVNRFEKWAIIFAAAGGLTGLGLGIAAIHRPNPADCRVTSPSGTVLCP